MEQTEDTELVRAIVEKEEWAIAYLFKEYYPRFVLFANRYLNDYQESEEAVTDVFVAFWKTPFITFENLPKVRTYLYVCIKNKCSTILKNRNTKKGKVNRHLKQLMVDAPAEGLEASFYHQIIYAEVVAEVSKQISTLPPGCEAICRMIFFEGRKAAEIASSLGLSVSTVKAQKARGIKLLKEKFGGRKLPGDLFFFLLM